MQPIDLYLIAGQSNASGYTFFSADDFAKEDPRCISGFDHILYTGNARSTNGDRASQHEYTLCPVRAGLGRSHSHMGPEVGMAVSLSSVYNEKSGRYAVIVRYAAGGTCLLDSLSGENAPEGNWVSPGMAEKLIASGTGVRDPEKTGGLYRRFFSQLQRSLAELAAGGFCPRPRALYWMQGENDKGKPAEYAAAFPIFAADMRRDLAALLGAEAAELPILIGEISETSGGADPKSLSVNRAFIDMQRLLPAAVPNSFVIANAGFAVSEFRDGRNIPLSTDIYHWNFKDHFAIGKLIGECIKKNILGQ